MNSCHPLLCTLFLLTPGQLLIAQEQSPAAIAPAEVNIPAPTIEHYYYYRLTEGTNLHINFHVQMVPDEEVGKEVQAGFFTCSIPDCYKAIWLSTSRIRLTLTRDLPPLQILRIDIPDELKSLKGDKLSGANLLLSTSKGSVINYSSTERNQVFIRPREPEYSEKVRELLPGLCYSYRNRRFPLSYRPATVADALNNWDDFDCASNFNLDQNDREELAKHPADEVIPDAWIIEPPGIAESGEIIYLILPNSKWNDAKKSIKDDDFSYISAPSLSYELSKTVKDKGNYEVKLQFDMPAAASDVTELLRSLTWHIREDAHSNEWKPLEWKDGALRSKVRGKDITLTPTATENLTLSLMDGNRKEGISSVTLAAETGGREVRLKCSGKYTPACTPAPADITELADTTMLQPATPFIYTDVNANHLQLRGSTTIRCRYGQLENGRARIWKLSSTPADAVRLLRDYSTLYTGQEFATWREDNRQSTNRKAANLSDEKIEDNRVNTAALPGVQATAERPLQAGANYELNLPLAELFAGQPTGGFYFIDIEGTPLRNSKTPVVNQSLIQVTDLGLLWKSNGNKLLAWAYHLSSAAEVPTATLRLLDKDGNQLSELPVRNGIAQGDFPTGTRYLQLSTADDCVTLIHHPGDLDHYCTIGNSYRLSELLQQGITPADFPTPLVYLFSDRSLYRPSETAHIKGIARWVKNNELTTPDIETITAKVTLDDNEVGRYDVTLQDDGTFTLDLPVNSVGLYRVTFDITHKGDADNTSPDKAAVVACIGPDKKPENNADFPRSATIAIYSEEFRRNEFEVKSSLTLRPESRQISIEATATNFTTTPVAHGIVNWNIHTTFSNFYPNQEQWYDFRFGDFRENPWDFFYAYYYGGSRSSSTDYMSREGTLDENGQGSATFSLPSQDFPRLCNITATTTVTNGNEQSIRSVQKSTLHPADVYVGLRPHVTLAKVGGNIPVDLIAIKPDGTPWDGPELQALITVERTVFHPYRYGSFNRSSVRNSSEKNTTQTIPVSLTGKQSTVNIPVDSAGRYDIIVSGKDSQGRDFRSATRHFIWGDEVSPWEHMQYDTVELVPDKPLYKTGDTAKILIKTPVDAELLVTIDRDRVLRHFRRSVTVDKPVIEIPIEAGDAPVVYVSVGLVQNDGNRSRSGKPQEKLGACALNIAPEHKNLTVNLQTPQQLLYPGEECTVSGTITGPDGQPVANADVTLYAEDEGTLQVTGYDLPNPAAYFYSEEGRPHQVATYSALRYLSSENLRQRDFGNKGVFIGGGDDMECEGNDALSDDQTAYIRSNFTPCALWLSSVRTDANGNFRATYSNPDTLTRYRLMAVASAGDKFGAGQAQYTVKKPIMLEPIAPMSATEGDELDLPVTVSMLPDDMPTGYTDKAVTWRVSMSGSNVELPTTTQTVTLSSNEPVTIHFPIKVKETGPVKLQWSIQAEDAEQNAQLRRVKDAVELSFQAVPPTPFLREIIFTELPGNRSANLNNWLQRAYRNGTPAELTFSPSPLIGMSEQLNYLFTYPYGCTEQLCSTALPWILRENLQHALGLNYPKDKDSAAILAEVKRKLQQRKLGPAKYRYWDDDSTPTAFSAYAVLISHLMGEYCFSDFYVLKTSILEKNTEPYLGLLVLALCDKLDKTLFDMVLNRINKERLATSPQENWVLAYCAGSIGHPQAAELIKRANADNRSVVFENYHLPPLATLQALFAARFAADSPVTITRLRRCIQNSPGRYSTWRNAWMILAVDMYCRNKGLKSLHSTINGVAVSTDKPLNVSTSIGDTTTYTAGKNTVYVSGRTEGYLRTAQPEQAIDKGISVARHYEQLQPDGSWKPTSTFKVGDIVKVNLSVKLTNKEQPMRYLVLEDRLPAGFEAVNPELSSQALPAGINTQSSRDWWRFAVGINNKEFLKDRVRLFANHIGPNGLESSYVARVVRSGRVTAPAATAELMYNPEVHGLSVPQHFEISPR